MKKLILILISIIIVFSVAVMVIFIAEPYRVKKHNRLAGPVFKEAEIQYGNKKYSKALKGYKKIVDDYYKSRYTFGALEKTVEIYDKYRRRGPQTEYLEKFIKLFYDRKESARYIYKLADITFMLKGDEEKALKYYQHIINKFPSTNWAKKASDRLTDIAIRIYSPEKAMISIDKTLSETLSGKRKDYLLLKKIEIMWKHGKVREAYEITAEISRPLKDFVKNNLIFNQLIVREEPTYEHLILLSQAYDRLGFSRKAEQAEKRADKLKDAKNR
ncbi:MAG: hypothetical protein PF545_07390 [Elusimicrobia bacterium]|jgi:outer membrane protein assembly factor BamD (BamD/ComL family)|nr:hypothetical protein [Elusimicrobiota bacterium]